MGDDTELYTRLDPKGRAKGLHPRRSRGALPCRSGASARTQLGRPGARGPKQGRRARERPPEPKAGSRCQTRRPGPPLRGVCRTGRAGRAAPAGRSPARSGAAAQPGREPGGGRVSPRPPPRRRPRPLPVRRLRPRPTFPDSSHPPGAGDELGSSMRAERLCASCAWVWAGVWALRPPPLPLRPLGALWLPPPPPPAPPASFHKSPGAQPVPAFQAGPAPAAAVPEH